VKEPTHQTHAIRRARLQCLHGLARLGAGVAEVLFAGKPIPQVAQQEHRIPGLQSRRFGAAIQVQPAMPLHHQMETGAAHALGAGMPAAAVTADMEQAGIEL